MGPLNGKELMLHPKPFFTLDDIKLSAKHQPLVEALSQRPMRVDELAAATNIVYQDLTRLLYALTMIRVVVRAEEAPVPVAAPVPVPVDAPVPVPVAAPVPVPVAAPVPVPVAPVFVTRVPSCPRCSSTPNDVR